MYTLCIVSHTHPFNSNRCAYLQLAHICMIYSPICANICCWRIFHTRMAILIQNRLWLTLIHMKDGHLWEESIYRASQKKVGFRISNSPVVWDDQRLTKLTDTAQQLPPPPATKNLEFPKWNRTSNFAIFRISYIFMFDIHNKWYRWHSSQP